MVFPDMPVYIPKPLGERELNISNQWKARWNDRDPLPKKAPVLYAYAVVLVADRGYLTRARGTEIWNIVEGDLNPGETASAWVKRAAAEQLGASGGKVEMLGFLECRATSHNTNFPKDTITLQPIYVVAAKTLKDMPRDGAWERRRLPMNEFAAALRERYAELEEYMQEAVQRYAVWRAKGQA